MKAPTEIYSVIFLSKYRDPKGNPIPCEYTVGQAYDIANKSIVPEKIAIVKDRIIISFGDGGSHSVLLKESECEIFRRPVIEKEETNTEE